MSAVPAPSSTPQTPPVTVRYWAAARAAAGTESDRLDVEGPISLAEVRSRVAALHPDSGMQALLGICSVLVGEQPVGTADPADVAIEPGSSVEFLPPFAGG